MLRNECSEIKLAVLELGDGKAQSIAEGLETVLDEFRLWGSVKMLISDTTSVNTGRKSGVVVRLQRMFAEKGHDKPHFVSCQHHVLDRVLRLVMDQELCSNNRSPNVDYFFVNELKDNYEKLKESFQNGEHVIHAKIEWRDDMKFLFHLTHAYRFYVENGHVPFVKFQTIPNISNARWNSRAILVLLAYFLQPQIRDRLKRVCDFVAYTWADHWFSNQMHCSDDYTVLSSSLQQYGSAMKCLQRHWTQEQSPINITRTNQCCERAIKVMQDLYTQCKDKSKLSSRFLLSNDLNC